MRPGPKVSAHCTRGWTRRASFFFLLCALISARAFIRCLRDRKKRDRDVYFFALLVLGCVYTGAKGSAYGPSDASGEILLGWEAYERSR